MLRKTIAALALGTGLLAPVLATPAPAAQAGGSYGCVTREEFRLVSTGKTLLWVEARFDTHGRLEYQGGGYKTKSYLACTGPDWGRYGVYYRHHHGAWRLDSKWYDSCYDCY
jgi:hypothetical protein